MDTLILYHHLGLGDHMMCHGLVRETCKNHPKVIIFAKSHNLVSVQFMFRDINNLEIVEGDDEIAKSFIDDHPEMKVRLIGFSGIDWIIGPPLDVQFYNMGGVTIDKKYSEFKVIRDSEREEKLFAELVPDGVEDYIFLHHDVERGMEIKADRTNTDLPAISPDIKYTDCIFDYCKLIENAAEVHLIDSSFQHMIDCLNPYNCIPEQKLVIHRYSRHHLFDKNKERVQGMMREAKANESLVGWLFDEEADAMMHTGNPEHSVFITPEAHDHIAKMFDLYTQENRENFATEAVEAPTRQKDWEVLI